MQKFKKCRVLCFKPYEKEGVEQDASEAPQDDQNEGNKASHEHKPHVKGHESHE